MTVRRLRGKAQGEAWELMYQEFHHEVVREGEVLTKIIACCIRQ